MSVKLIHTHGEQSSNCHIVNIEFTRWEQIENLQYDNCTFIHLVYIQYSKYDKTIASCLKSIPPPPPVPFTILMSPYCLTIHHSLHYIWINLLWMAISQSINELKTGGKTFDNPNDLFVRLDKKKPSKVVISTLHACLIGTA